MPSCAEETTSQTSLLAPSPRRRPSRKPFPEHLPRERVVVPAPTSCPYCGSETLEVVPRSWKVIHTVRERFSCRACEAISQPPARFHVTPRGFIGANLLATILFEKLGQHQPLNRQSERYAREGIDLSVSTLADQVGAATAALAPLVPLHDLIARHVLAAERLHADDTTVSILARGKTDTGRIWTYVRDERPFGGSDPPAALYFASRDRRQEKRATLSRSSTGVKPIDYMLKSWERFALFLDDGRACLSNNAAERALRGFALGRRAWMFAGSDRAAAMATLIATAKLNDVDPQAWLPDVLTRIAGMPQGRLAELLPWNWRAGCAEQR
jgi:transposase